MNIEAFGDLGDIAKLGLTLSEAKQILAGLQQMVVAGQADDHAALRPDCSSCGQTCHVKDWRLHRVATLFGPVPVRLPRFRCGGCGHGETGNSWLSYCRSTPEFDQLRAHVSALMPYRVAAGLLEHLLPVEIGMSPETLRSHTLKVGEQLRDVTAVKPAVGASAITITLDLTFIRGCRDGERHLEVRVGNVETSGGGRQVFGAVPKADTEIAVLIRRGLQDGRPCRRHRVDGLHRRLFRSAVNSDRGRLSRSRPSPIGSTSPCGYSTRSRQRADCRPTRRVGCRQRQRSSRKLNVCIGGSGTAKPSNARRTLERVRKVMHVFRGEGVHRAVGCALVSQAMACVARGPQVSPGKEHASSIMQKDTGPASGSARR